MNEYLNDPYDPVFLIELALKSKLFLLLEKLSNHKLEMVRINVAKNPNCTVKILEKMLNDNSFLVKNKLFLNEKCTAKILKNIYKEFKDNEDIVLNIKSHPNWKLTEFE